MGGGAGVSEFFFTMNPSILILGGGGGVGELVLDLTAL